MATTVIVCESTKDFAEAMLIRQAVFIGEQKVPAELEPDEYDAVATHLLLLEDDTPIGTARLIDKSDKGDGIVKIGRVAITKAFRGHGHGTALMHAALDFAAQNAFLTAVLDSQTYVIPFYEKLGFIAEGPEFNDAGIAHRHMQKSLIPLLFPHTKHCIHLNHAGTSPIAEPVAEAARGVLLELQSENAFNAYKNDFARQGTLRQTIGRMINAPDAAIALVKNTSHGLAIASQAIVFSPGQNVVVAGCEYPSNIYPWQALKQTQSVETKLVPADTNGWVSEDDLIAACDDNTRVLTTSWVQWHTGQRMDLHKLGTFCRERGILFVVDIVQGVGALKLDLANLPIDMATAGCHKWMLAPGGIGFLYIHPDVLPTLLPTNVGWNWTADPIAWDKLQFSDTKPTAARYEEGTPAILNVAALLASLQILESVGWENIEARVLALANHAQTLLTEKNMQMMSRPNNSGAVTFRHPTVSHTEILARFEQANIVIAERYGNLRIAPHFYNTKDDIEKAVALV
jgi:cysteine desulfurase / selenocysteine lyase